MSPTLKELKVLTKDAPEWWEVLQPLITKDDLLMWSLVLNDHTLLQNTPYATLDLVGLWNRAAKMMQPGERMGFFMAMYEHREAIFTHGKWKPDTIPEYDQSAVDGLREAMFDTLLGHLQSQCRPGTWS